jgi:hypothetical protein
MFAPWTNIYHVFTLDTNVTLRTDALIRKAGNKRLTMRRNERQPKRKVTFMTLTMFKVFTCCWHVDVELLQEADVLRSISANTIVFACAVVKVRYYPS